MEPSTGVPSSTIHHIRYKCREASGADFAGEKEKEEEEEREEERKRGRGDDVAMLQRCDVCSVVFCCAAPDLILTPLPLSFYPPPLLLMPTDAYGCLSSSSPPSPPPPLPSARWSMSRVVLLPLNGDPVGGF